MKTLVYFASGRNRSEYQRLDFERIILVDKCFRNKKLYKNNGLQINKVTCIGMDCLESIKFLKQENIKIDCFVSLNEGLFEGGGRYAINSDLFLGYVMPLLKDNYIHIMNQNYYCNMYNVSMDLPFEMKEISENDKRYISPFIFSKDDYHKNNAKVFQMLRIFNIQNIFLNPKLKISIINDSIWNYYNELDRIVILFTSQGQRNFFDKLPKVIDLNHSSIDEIFSICKKNKIEKIGFTPWGRGDYNSFINRVKEFNDEYPKELYLFHLNKNDYKKIKKYAANKK